MALDIQNVDDLVRVGSFLDMWTCGLNAGPQVVRLGGKGFYLLSCLAGSVYMILLIRLKIMNAIWMHANHLNTPETNRTQYFI